MATDTVRGFSEIKEFIRDNPKLASSLVQKWEEFVDKFGKDYPELSVITNAEQFTQWALENNFEPSLWRYKEIRDAYFVITQQQDTPQEQSLPTQSTSIFQQAGGSAIGVGLITASLLKKEEIMENDKRYAKIKENLKKEWIKDNPDKDLADPAALDYLYGALSNPNASTIDTESRKQFTEKFKSATTYYAKKKNKLYGKHEDDPAVSYTKGLIKEHARERYNYLNRIDSDVSWDNVHSQIEKNAWAHFAINYQEKAEAYAGKNVQINDALESLKTNQALAHPSTPRVHYIDKSHPPRTPNITTEDAAVKLQSISPKQHRFENGLVDLSGRPISVAVLTQSLQQEAHSAAVTFTPHASPSTQSTQPPSHGRGSAVDHINRLPSLHNRARLAKQESKLLFKQVNKFLLRFGTSHPLLIIILIFFAILFAFTGILAGGVAISQNQFPTPTPTPAVLPIPGFQLSLSQNTLDFGKSTLHITYTYTPPSPVPLDRIMVSFTLSPPTIVFTSATGVFSCDPGPICDANSTKISWPLSNAQNQSPGGFTLTVTNNGPTVPVALDADVLP